MSQTAEVKLTELIGPAFFDVFWDIERGLHSAYWLEGGRGSLKSSFTASMIIRGMLQDPQAWGVALRKVGNTLRDSVVATFEWAIGKMQMSLLWRVTTSPAEIVYRLTGQKIICRGLDEPLKLKSIKAKKGYFKFLWFEEGQEYDGIKELRSVIQSVLRGGKRFFEFVTFNPPEDEFHWINVEAAATVKDRLVHHSTYLEVNPDWLGPKFLSDAKDLEERDPLTYQNEYLGKKVGNRPEVIFAGKTRNAEFEIDPKWEGPYYGLDFGFSSDPMACTELFIEMIPKASPTATQRMRLYVNQSEAETAVELDDIPAFLNRFPNIRRHKIRADSARPDLISHLRSKGFDVVAVEKGEGSVEAGLVFLLNFVEIVMHKTRAKTHIDEVPKYKYKIDPITKQVTRKPVDKDNHHFDSDRYAIEPIIKRKKGFFS